MHFVGATLALTTVWTLGDVFLGVVILPNLLAMIFLSGKVREMTIGYFKRQPWIENYEAHKRSIEEKRSRKRQSRG